MKCPIDQTTLLINQRSGIELDYCPECRGVWLDRGELDKIILKEQDTSGQIKYGKPSDTRVHPSADYETYHPQRKRKESFLGDLFDF